MGHSACLASAISKHAQCSAPRPSCVLPRPNLLMPLGSLIPFPFYLLTKELLKRSSDCTISRNSQSRCSSVSCPKTDRHPSAQLWQHGRHSFLLLTYLMPQERWLLLSYVWPGMRGFVGKRILSSSGFLMSADIWRGILHMFFQRDQRSLLSYLISNNSLNA